MASSRRRMNGSRGVPRASYPIAAQAEKPSGAPRVILPLLEEVSQLWPGHREGYRRQVADHGSSHSHEIAIRNGISYEQIVEARTGRQRRRRDETSRGRPTQPVGRPADAA